jgi:glycosyltransferase involved in cell wall biosynthesis
MGVYNGEPYLGQALESVLGQTYDDLEAVVVDDGSTDGTPAILAACADPRVRIVRQENRGLTRALNRGLGMARGEYVARQDADDVSLPGRLARQVAFLDAHPDIALAGTWTRLVDWEGDQLGSLHFETDPERIAAVLPVESQFIHGSIMARRALLEEAGGYREAFRYAQDYDLLLRLAARRRLANVPEELYCLRLRRDKLSYERAALQVAYAKLARQLWRERQAGGRDSLETGRAVEELLPAPDVRDAIGYDRQMGYFYLRAGKLRKARRELAAAIRRGGAGPGPYFFLCLSLTGPRLAPRMVRAWERFRGGSRSLR